MKSKAAEESTKKRRRRTIEELIADLENEKKALIERLKAKELKASPAHKLALTALKYMDKALGQSGDEADLRSALNEARGPLAEYLQNKGVRLPKSRRPRGARAKE